MIRNRIIQTAPLAVLTVSAGLFVAGLSAWMSEAVKAPAAGPAAPAHPGPPLAFLEEWCFDCHGDGARKGGLSLDDPAALSSRDWGAIRSHVLLHTMPPEDEPAPDAAERRRFAADLQAWLTSLPDPPAPARIRRLSRNEYNGTVSALFGVSLRPADEFPDDEAAHGFDNNGDLQPLPPALMERYVASAAKVVRQVLLPEVPPSTVTRVAPEEFQGSGFISRGEADGHYWIEDSRPVRFRFQAPVDGDYRIHLKAYGHQAGDEPVKVEIGGAAVAGVLSARRREPDTVSATVSLRAGGQFLTFRFCNPFSDPGHPEPHRRHRHLLVRYAEVEGPVAVPWQPTEAFRRLVPSPPAPDADIETKLHAAARVMRDFGERAWRRSLTEDEISRLMQLCGRGLDAGMRFDEAVATGIQAVLTSPNFLFLTDPADAGDQRWWALASRLSYFLWSEPPDDRLREAAARGFPRGALEEEAARMLADPRSRALVRDFAGQWLQLRNVALARPDPDRFPEITPDLRAAMQEESTLFLGDLLHANLPVIRLIDAGWTFVDDALAAHYGLPATGGSGFRRAELTGTGRRGILGQASVLMLTSTGTRTSPVLRGKWILENLLGLEPPPPPPNVPTLAAESTANPAAAARSVREALEIHRSRADCAACHRAIDPPGFALEGFDAVGRRRTVGPGEADATVFSGEEIRDLEGLTEWLSRVHGAEIVRQFTRRLMIYALGRGLSPSEERVTDGIAVSCGGRDARMRDIVLAVIRSGPFRGQPNP